MKIALLCLLLNGALLAQVTPPVAPSQPVKSAPANDPNPLPAKGAKAGEAVAGETALAQLCEQQRLKIRALEDNREKMTAEIQRLSDEIRRLNDILAKVRSQLGNDQPRPTAH